VALQHGQATSKGSEEDFAIREIVSFGSAACQCREGELVRGATPPEEATQRREESSNIGVKINF
jgi:hypothetical protein